MTDPLSPWFSDDAWWNRDDYFGPPSVGSDYSYNVNEVLFGPPGVEDDHAQHLFMEAYFENNSRAYLDLIDYMWREYGIDFEEAFSWDDFRAWYDSSAV